MRATKMLIRPFDEVDGPAVIALWQTCALTRPWNDPQHNSRSVRLRPCRG